MKHIVVTGANGQLGFELKKATATWSSYEVHFFDRTTWDISNMEQGLEIMRKYEPTFIVNCAAYTAVDKAESDQENCLSINATSPKILATLANQCGAHLIHISTDFVFDGTKNEPYIETDTVHPISVYGATKLEGEQHIQNTALSYSIIRTSWLYSSFGANFVKTMMKLGAERPALNVIFDQVGTPTYAKDLAEAILSMIPQINQPVQEVLHYSNEGVASWYDFAEEIMTLSQLPCVVSPITTAQYPTPAARPKYSVMNKSKIKETYHITIPHWKKSLKECLHIISLGH